MNLTIKDVKEKMRLAFNYNNTIRVGKIVEVNSKAETFKMEMERDGGSSFSSENVKQFSLEKCENIKIL